MTQHINWLLNFRHYLNLLRLWRFAGAKPPYGLTGVLNYLDSSINNSQIQLLKREVPAKIAALAGESLIKGLLSLLKAIASTPIGIQKPGNQPRAIKLHSKDL